MPTSRVSPGSAEACRRTARRQTPRPSPICRRGPPQELRTTDGGSKLEASDGRPPGTPDRHRRRGVAHRGLHARRSVRAGSPRAPDDDAIRRERRGGACPRGPRGRHGRIRRRERLRLQLSAARLPHGDALRARRRAGHPGRAVRRRYARHTRATLTVALRTFDGALGVAETLGTPSDVRIATRPVRIAGTVLIRPTLDAQSEVVVADEPCGGARLVRIRARVDTRGGVGAAALLRRAVGRSEALDADVERRAAARRRLSAVDICEAGDASPGREVAEQANLRAVHIRCAARLAGGVGPTRSVDPAVGAGGMLVEPERRVACDHGRDCTEHGCHDGAHRHRSPAASASASARPNPCGYRWRYSRAAAPARGLSVVAMILIRCRRALSESGPSG